MTPSSPITELTGIGPAAAKKFARLRIHTIHDLIYHTPFRYDDYSASRTIANFEPNQSGTITATFTSIRNTKTRRRTALTRAIAKDPTGQIQIIWFNAPYLKSKLNKTDTFLISGKLTNGKFGTQLVNPEINLADTNTPPQLLRPIYPATQGVASEWIRRHILRNPDIFTTIQETLPDDLRQEYKLAELSLALRLLHAPASLDDIKHAKRRLAYEELIRLQLATNRRKEQLRGSTATALATPKNHLATFTSRLPFTLTPDQSTTISDITTDLASTMPTNRLIQGDVGSGKTVIAMATLDICHANQGRSAYMAPTEVLAKQQFKEIRQILPPTANIALLTNSYQTIGDTESTKKEVLAAAAKQQIDIIIGTHALLYNPEAIHDLDLAIIDEQHRFGVKQRKTLISGNHSPHFISMTATPIPRTLALTAYSDLDISNITTLPAHKQPITTELVSKRSQAKTISHITDELNAGRQAFVICPLIEISPEIETASIEQVAEELPKQFPDHALAILHGKLPPAEKQHIIDSFTAGTIDILLSTTVIEVGINVPNATIMIIRGAERFGLAQLHQIRGRVGRGKHKSTCYLWPEKLSSTARERLNILKTTQDGFTLSQKDLELRGEGDLYGTKQSGLPTLRYANLASPSAPRAIQDCQHIARALLNHPDTNKKALTALTHTVHFE